MPPRTQAVQSNRDSGVPGSAAIAAVRDRTINELESFTNHSNSGVALLATLMLGYIEVMWLGKPVHETAVAPYYAAVGESRFTPDSWHTREDLAANRRMGARAQSTNLTQLFLGVLIAAIVVIRVFIPTVQDAIADSNASGTTKTILDLLSLFAALLLLVSLASPLMRST